MWFTTDPTRIEIDRWFIRRARSRQTLCSAIAVASALLAITATAHSQAPQRNAEIQDSLQHHDVRTPLRDVHPEPAAKPDAAVEARPPSACIDNEAGRLACGATAQENGVRWRAPTPDYARRSGGVRMQGGPDGSFTDLDQAIRQEPGKAEALVRRGVAYLERRDFQRAIADFDRAIKLSPRHAAAIASRAAAYRGMGDLERALQDYELLSRINPKDMQAHLQRGTAHWRLHHHDEAVEAFGRLTQLEPDNVLGYTNRGHVFLDMRAYDRAIRDFDQAINVKPDHAPAFNLRGLVYAALGETRRSIQDFDQALMLDRNFAEAYLNRGELYQGSRNYDRALADYDEAVRLKPKDAYFLYSRGLVRRILGDEAGAKRDIARAKEIEPEIGP
jgi:tetratricopeptide (TPR) repeat protein